MENKLKTEVTKTELVKLIREAMGDSDFYNKLKYELNQGDKHYEKCYNQALGKFAVDTPDYLADEKRQEFYEYLDSLLKKDPIDQNYSLDLVGQMTEDVNVNVQPVVEDDEQIKNKKSDSLILGDTEIEECDDDIEEDVSNGMVTGKHTSMDDNKIGMSSGTDEYTFGIGNKIRTNKSK